MEENYIARRQLLRSGWQKASHGTSPQAAGMPEPEREKPFDESLLIPLGDPADTVLGRPDFTRILAERQSLRKFSGDMTTAQLGYLLWATAGVREERGNRRFRTVPSAGCRHPIDTCLYIDRVTGLEPGLYRYVPSRHALLPLPGKGGDELREQVRRALIGQLFGGAVFLFWVAVPYRTEWRYDREAAKVIALDAGHIAQNGYLAATALGLGCCAIGAYVQEQADALFALDGRDEFVMYAGVFGPVAGSPS